MNKIIQPYRDGSQNIEARLAASVGQLEEPAAPASQAVQGVSKGEVLFALPPFWSYEATIQKLCDELNTTETLFPRTNLRMIFKPRKIS